MKKKILFSLLMIIVLSTTIGCRLNNKSNQTKNTNNNQTENKETTEQKENDDIIGKWETTIAVNSEDGKKTEDMRQIFGSSYSQYGSYLELKDDGTFIDAIQPITNGNKSNTGKYEIKRNYNKQGDCYIFLTYSDGIEEKLQKVILDESKTPYLVLKKLINGYQLSLKKK